ncbi:MAG: glutamine synthetase [Candidatus Thorarchaeota archaeon]|nr:glutamine synthetase [Candidatus Thorarchaeota archaeon]
MSEQIEYIELRFPDVLGRLKAMIIPCKAADTIEELRRDPALKKGTSLDGSSITGLASVELSDLRLVPDPKSLFELPYTAQRTAAVMCFLKRKGDDPDSGFKYQRDTRGVLHSVCEKYLPGKMQLKVKIEPEFHFITSEGDPFDTAGYADTYPRNFGGDVLIEIASAVREVGMQPRVIHHEVGEAQQEIEIDYADSIRMADFVLTFKNLARTIALSQEMDVTFLPKPFEGAAGNGLHCHLQLWDGEVNLFGKDGGDKLSDTGEKFIAGLLKHAKAITAIANPTVNSYKRLVPHHEAPVHISWGFMNRTVLVRVPLFEEAEKAAVEFRSADSMTNPYLLFAAIIAAGMDGIENNLVPPDPSSEDIFAMSDEERERLGIESLPTNLGEALNELEKDDVIRKALGSELTDAYIKIKRSEWREYTNSTVTIWEWKTYHGY